MKQWVEVAERLGAPMVRVFAGWPEGTAAERWDDMIVNLREAASFAQAAGVRLGLENEAGFTPSVAEHSGSWRRSARPRSGSSSTRGTTQPAGRRS